MCLSCASTAAQTVQSSGAASSAPLLAALPFLIGLRIFWSQIEEKVSGKGLWVLVLVGFIAFIALVLAIT